jgi:hypothetical protein
VAALRARADATMSAVETVARQLDLLVQALDVEREVVVGRVIDLDSRRRVG